MIFWEVSMKRRDFCTGITAIAALSFAHEPVMSALQATTSRANEGTKKVSVDVAALDRERVIRDAKRYLAEKPRTITSSHSDRTLGSLHDFFSEGDYWWPDPKNPGGPYIRRDGESNPDNFVAHREVLMRLSVVVPALAAAWRLTGEKVYAAKAREHVVAWFIDPATRMNPNLQYAQAIKGVTTGRGTGIIDTIHLVEVTRAVRVMKDSGVWTSPDEYAEVQAWFKDYVRWMTTSKNGIEERDATNNHGSCWVMQVAAFASFTDDHEQMQFCADRFRNKLIPEQVASDGSLPMELARTKPYSYSLFDMDILSTICQILSTESDSLWAFSMKDGRSMQKVIGYMEPFIVDKSKWPKAPDVEYFNDLPARQPSLLFGGLAYGEAEWINLWKRLNPEPTVTEIIRNFPIRQPVLWVS
jgi:Alginate lyase